MKNAVSLSCLLLAAALPPVSSAWAQEDQALHVVKSTVNAEAENAEFCLEFDKPLAATSPARLASALRLESDGKPISPANIVGAGTSLCLFPLEHHKDYRLDLNGLHGQSDNASQKMAEPYKTTFTIPDRSPVLAFTSKNGGVNEFGVYEHPLTLRAVNVAHAKIDVYRVTDPAAMARVWQDRAQTSLAPSESVYLARTKGQSVWHEDKTFAAAPNGTTEQEISLRDKLPELPPGLYLVVADAGKDDAKPASKGLRPLAAAWFTKSDFVVRALRDGSGLHTFASQTTANAAKGGLHLTAFNKKFEAQIDSESGADGIGLIAYPPKANPADLACIIATDANGNIAFADIDDVPVLSERPAAGDIRLNASLAAPGEKIDAALSLIASENAAPGATVLRLMQGDNAISEIPVPALTPSGARLSFAAPATQGQWTLRWQKADGTVLAQEGLRVAVNADATRLEVTSERDAVSTEGGWNVTIRSVSSTGKPMPLTGGRVMISWQKMDPENLGWQDYRFGTAAKWLSAPVHVADFLTDLQGVAQLRLSVPKPPQERGLYQAVLKVEAEADAGVADAQPLLRPLRPESAVIGIKPLAADARFPQNGLARFALIGLSPDGKPRDIANLSYQIYEEGRSFAWYQNEGRWQYKPEPQLRPIGGGPLSIKADGSSQLEWPVTAGNYRIEILDGTGKALAQTAFSAGWDSQGATAAQPLSISLPKILQPGREAIAHFTLPQPATLTAVIADQNIRKIVHETRPRGDNTLSFTPTADWPKTISLSLDAVPQGAGKPGWHAATEATIAQSKPKASEATAVTLTTADNPSAHLLHKDGSTVLTFGLQNNGDNSESYHYALTASPGLKIESGESGDIVLGGKQSKAFAVTVTGITAGTKDVRLDISGPHLPRLSRTWPLAVVNAGNGLRSGDTASVEPKQPLLPQTKTKTDATALMVSRRPMTGVAEILSALFNAHPFTTEELSASIDALRFWGDSVAASGLAPDFAVAARIDEQRAQLLSTQNADGGFGAYRNSDSTMENTAAALTALGPDTAESAKVAKAQAVAWLKQRLSNSWLDDKERAARAAAYAALAAADAIDPASLHYFSDTSATSALPAIADAHIAAAFKHSRDPNAAAFWIKKMLDDNAGPKSLELLRALAATDALSSDDVHAALAAMTQAMRAGTSPEITQAAALLRALAADNLNAGKFRIAIGSENRDVTGIAVLRANEIANARNADSNALFATPLSEAAAAPQGLSHGTALSRHIYRMNGVELTPPAKPARGEIYMIEAKGQRPEGDGRVAVQDGYDGSLRPIGCPVSAKLDTLSFLPWFTTHGLPAVASCSFSTHHIDVVLAPQENDDDKISVVYFARLDGAPASPPIARLLK